MKKVSIVSIAFLSLCLFVFLISHTSKKTIDPQLFHGTLLNKPRDIQSFEFTGIDNKPFNHQSLYGHWTILFFGFTRCGSMCPTAMGELAKMYRLLEQQHFEPKPQIVMITVDPKNDTLDKLNQYVEAFHIQFFGARAHEKALKALTQELGIAYTTVQRSSNTQQSYEDIEHTGAFLFLNPQAQLVAFSTPPHKANQLIEDYRLLTQ